MQAFCSRIVDSRAFERFIVAVILVNAVIIGLETSVDLIERFGGLLHLANDLVLWIFIVEAALKMTALGAGWYRYFASGWNVFDFAVIVLSLVPASGEFATVARLVRILRVLRLVSAMPKLRLLVATLMRCIPSMGHVLLLLSILFYIYGVMGYQFFHAVDPERWGTLGAALLTLFQVVTLEGWAEVMAKVMEQHPWAWVYFLTFVVIGTFVVINLFIAVVINSLEDAREQELEQLTSPPDHAELMTELRNTREALARLEARLTRDEPERVA
jgi:voltage-gated sodium channel